MNSLPPFSSLSDSAIDAVRGINPVVANSGISSLFDSISAAAECTLKMDELHHESDDLLEDFRGFYHPSGGESGGGAGAGAGAYVVESVSLVAPNNTTWLPRSEITAEAALAKMQKNFGKAVEEHRCQAIGEREMSAYATMEEIEFSSKEDRPNPETFSVMVAKEKNERHRPTMEDTHFGLQLPEGLLTGVFDGHSGAEVAKEAKQIVLKEFQNQLKVCGGNIFKALETTIHLTHEKIAESQKRLMRFGFTPIPGATVVLSFIQKETNLVYTATVGDSEANIYRKIGAAIKSIPLSVVRDWAHPKEAMRAAIALGRPEIAAIWPTATNRDFSNPRLGPKDLRFPPDEGVNVSRAIGDLDKTVGPTGSPALIHKPKITVSPPLKKGDVLILACDGLKDYVPEDEIAARVESADPAKALLERALETSEDNITIIAIRAE